jgi:hypothetical protein
MERNWRASRKDLRTQQVQRKEHPVFPCHRMRTGCHRHPIKAVMMLMQSWTQISSH